MASAWTTSGVDWTSATTMRNSRTEDIVREIYLAVNEREYYMGRTKAMQNEFPNPVVPVLDTVGRNRIENMTGYIQEKVSGWLLPLDEFNDRLNATTRKSVGTLGCFLDEATAPTGGANDSSDKYFFTYKNLDYEQNGNFETQYGIDLSLLRDPPSRVQLDWAKMIYDILQENLFISCEDWKMQVFGGGAIGFTLDGHGNIPSDYLNANEYRFYIGEQNDAQSVFTDTFQDVENKMNSNARLQIFFENIFKGKLIYTNTINRGLTMEYDRSYFVFKIKGDSQNFLFSDLEHLALSTASNLQDALNLLPFSNYEDGLAKDRITPETLTQARIDSALFSQTGIVPGDYHVTDSLITNFDDFSIPSTAQGSTAVVTQVNSFVKINKQNLLSYYTAP
tara:strand:+ start:341 stop:1519 length:1179 start_codon:yes stop_codon:yes gene_type:complete